jgi:hypothetical protein
MRRNAVARVAKHALFDRGACIGVHASRSILIANAVID